MLKEPLLALQAWVRNKLKNCRWTEELPQPLNPGIRLEAFDWCCEQSRFSTVGQGEDTVVFWTVIYRIYGRKTLLS
jgi:hypothetical protein